MIIAVPSEDSFISQTSNSILNMPPHHVTRWTDKTLNNIAQQFNLELIILHHEKLQPNHYSWYVSNKFQNKFLKSKLIDTTFKRKIISKLSGVYALFFSKSAKSIKNEIGHTVLAVYEKK